MTAELPRQVRALMEQGASPISPEEIRERACAPRPVLATAPAQPQPGLRWAAVAAACLVVAVCGVAIMVALAARQPAPAAGRAPARRGTLLTAAQLHRVAAASTAALARSARAYITYGGFGPYRAFQSEYVAYSGENYSLAGSVINPAPGDRPGQVTWFAARVVGGHAYAQELGSRGWRWIRYPLSAGGRAAARALDPRALLHLLTPGERFRFAGRVTAGGVLLDRLQATAPANVPGLPALAGARPGGMVTALAVLVDSRGVVHQVDIGLREATLVAVARVRGQAARLVAQVGQGMLPYGTPGSAVVTVTFADFGRPQSITAPSHAIDVDTPWGLGGRPLPPEVLPAGAAGS